MSTVFAFDEGRRTNAELIWDCARLGYLNEEMVTLDPTYGLGRFWTHWRPEALYRHDIDPERAPDGVMDFRALKYADKSFEAVTFDPPYKLNGTGGGHASDEAYGVNTKGVRWQDRMTLCEFGIVDCARVLKPNGVLLIKCQDQVSSGKVRWQTTRFAWVADQAGCDLVDMLHLSGHREQPGGRSQVHARRNYSTMLVCKKPPRPRRRHEQET